MRRLLGAALALLLAAPSARAEDKPPLRTKADVEQALKDLAADLRKNRNEAALEEFAERARAGLNSENPLPELREALLKAVPDIEKSFVDKKRAGTGRCRSLLAQYFLDLADPKADGALLKGLEKHLDCEDLARVGYDGLSKRRDKLADAELAKLWGLCETRIKKVPQQISLIVGPIRRLGGRDGAGLKAVSMIVDAAAQAKKSSQPQALEKIVEVLGEWWEGTPHFALRIPLLLDIYAQFAPVKDPNLRIIADQAQRGLELLTPRSFPTPPDAEKWWKAITKDQKGKEAVPDPEVLIRTLKDAREEAGKSKEPDAKTKLANRVIELIGKWNAPTFSWATPVLIELFTWNEPEYGDLLKNVNLALGQIQDPRAVTSLLKIEKEDKEVSVRVAAIEALGKLAKPKDPEVVAALREALRDPEARLQRPAVVALGRLRAEEAEDQITGWLKGVSSIAYQDGLVALGRMGGKKSVEFLLGLLDKEEYDTAVPGAIRALAALPEIPFPDAVAEKLLALWKNLENPDWWKGRMKLGGRDVLRAELLDAFLGGRLDVAGARSHRGVAHAKFMDTLRAIVADPNKDLAKTALRGLGGVEDAKSVSAIMFETVSGKDPERRAEAWKWVKENVAADYREEYFKILKDTESPYRLEVVGFLGKPGVWETQSCYENLLGFLEREGREKEDPRGAKPLEKAAVEKRKREREVVVKIIEAVLQGAFRPHPLKSRIPDLIKLMEDPPQADNDYLSFAIGGLLDAWMTTAPCGRTNLPIYRKEWKGFWDKKGNDPSTTPRNNLDPEPKKDAKKK
ncbi:MAG: HEAT repeat domain-containing protein [Planctomycetales bacterium]|nr:HEAT repeat domain-containing protein [Planctomycetales bacterium]